MGDSGGVNIQRPMLARWIKRLALLRYTANHACAPTAEWRGMIGMIIATNMNHERAALHICHFQAWREYRLRGVAIGVDK